MKCYNSFCPFRMNDDGDENNCKKMNVTCLSCPR